MDLATDGGFVMCGMTIDLRYGAYPTNQMWLVKTDCMGNDSIWDNINCSLTTSENQNELNNTFSEKLYPNPNNGNMFFEYGQKASDIGELSFYDLLGRKLVDYYLPNENRIISISETALNNGIYFYVHRVNGSIIKSEKIIIAK